MSSPAAPRPLGDDARGRAVRIIVIGYGLIVSVVVSVLWFEQLTALPTPCTVPGCTWPRLSSEGYAALAALGLPPHAWVLFATAMSALCIFVPFALGVIIARAQVRWFVPLLWFTLALGTLSAVPTGPLAAALRLITLAAWFTVFAMYPTARLRPRWVAAAPIGAIVVTFVLQLPAVAAQEASSDATWWGLEAGGYILCVAVIVAAQIVQFRRGDGQTRRQIGLLLAAFALFLLLGAVNVVLNLRIDPAATGYGTLGGGLMYEISNLFTLLLMGCVAVAMVRDGAYGTRIVVDRALVAAIALLGAGLVYGVTVAVASAVLSGWLPAALAAVVTAAALASTYARIARTVGRLVYGDADDPTAVASALDARVAAVEDPADLLPAIAEELTARLRFPAVRITDADGADAETGSWSTRTARILLCLDEREIGIVEVALRPRQRRLTARDRAALGASAGPLAAALTARRLTAEVRRSRLEVLIGRDDERRALRRRLHDEVGPTLALAGHRLDAARTDLSQLDGAARLVADAIEQVRAVSRELRPPALDDLGLRVALVAFAEGLSLPLTIEAPERIRPGAIEVAAYRIVVEALLNAARHAPGSSAAVAVRRRADDWRIRIDDDGAGMPASIVPGVGMTAMRERAAELGGSVTFTPSPSGGTRVTVRIPTPSEDES